MRLIRRKKRKEIKERIKERIKEKPSSEHWQIAKH
jgi:hypothetical protein